MWIPSKIFAELHSQSSIYFQIGASGILFKTFTAVHELFAILDVLAGQEDVMDGEVFVVVDTVCTCGYGIVIFVVVVLGHWDGISTSLNICRGGILSEDAFVENDWEKAQSISDAQLQKYVQLEVASENWEKAGSHGMSSPFSEDFSASMISLSAPTPTHTTVRPNPLLTG